MWFDDAGCLVYGWSSVEGSEGVEMEERSLPRHVSRSCLVIRGDLLLNTRVAFVLDCIVCDHLKLVVTISGFSYTGTPW